MRQKTIRGFTIPELIITLGVATIILSTAVPGVSTTIKNNRLATQVNNIITDIHFARSEASKRDVRVILCRSQYPNASSPHCSTDSGTEYTWTWGYLIFADDGTAVNSVYDSSSDILLRRGQPAPSGVKPGTKIWNSTRTVPAMKTVPPPSCRSVMTAGQPMGDRSSYRPVGLQNFTVTIYRPVNPILPTNHHVPVLSRFRIIFTPGGIASVPIL